jgi:drug/metabolite transporter (DMT)-like permease/GNAT superfamily N-acetyltransferase
MSATAARTTTTSELDVRPLATSDPTAAALLDAYAREIEGRFVNRPACRVETVADEYAEPGGTFLVVYDDGRPIACGGLRALPDGSAELKRMYVVPEARGRGVARRLLARLEDEARRLGYSRLRLDTASQLNEAKALYRSSGYHEIDDYNGNPAASHWFEKELVPAEDATAPPGWLVWLALGTIYLIWGSTYLAIRVMVETVPPLLGAGFRFLIAGAVFYAFLALRRGAASVRFNGRELLAAGAAGTLLCFGGNGLVTVAEQKVPSGIAATLIASVPLWIILFRRLSHDPLNRVALLGVLIGFAGVGVLMLPGERPAGLSIGPMLLVVAAAASWAIGSYYPRRWSLPPDTMLSTSLQMLVSGALMVAVGAGAGEFGDVNMGGFSTKSIAGFVWLVTAGSLVAYTAYTWLLKNAPISKVATYAYVNPVVAIFLGWLLLDETITGTIVVGATLIVASVALVVSRESR